MQGWDYGKGLIYYRSMFRLTKLAFLWSRAAFSFTLFYTLSDVWLQLGYSISLIRDPARGTSQLYLCVAWTSAFKQFFFLCFSGVLLQVKSVFFASARAMIPAYREREPFSFITSQLKKTFLS